MNTYCSFQAIENTIGSFLLHHGFMIFIINRTYCYFRIRSKLKILNTQDHLLAQKYSYLLNIKGIIGILPWALMAYGIYGLGIPSIIHFARIGSFSLLWHAIFIICHVINGYLIFFNSGGRFEIDYPFFHSRLGPCKGKGYPVILLWIALSAFLVFFYFVVFMSQYRH